MKLGFVVDPLDHLKPSKDSSIAMMREAARRGHEIHAFEAREMFVRDGAVMTTVRELRLTGGDDPWYEMRPDQETPVSTTSRSRGSSTSTPLRLCSRAPRMTMVSGLMLLPFSAFGAMAAG